MAELSSLGLPSGIPSDSVLDLVPTGESGEIGITNQPVSVGGDLHARRVNREMSRAEPHVMAQREQMREADRFMHSHQLSDTDAAALAAQKRPDTVINELQKFVKFASGIERRTQQALIFNPRTMEDQDKAVLSEQLTKEYEWFCDQSQATFERSEAFEQMLIVGLGIVDTGLTRITNPSGAPRYTKCDPFQFWWPECNRQNFGLGTSSPVRWLARESNMDVDEAIRKWPDQALFLRAAAGGAPNEDQFPDFGYGAKKPIPYVVPWTMTAPLNKGGGGSLESKPGKCAILEWQEYRDEDGLFFYDPRFKDTTWLNKADFIRYRARLRLLFKQDITDYDPQDHRVYYRSYLLQRRILLQEPRPLTSLTGDVGYTWNVMTGAYDRSDKVFVGKVRLFMPTQRYTNAFFRQALEIMGASTKGGYLAETGALTPGQKNDIVDTGSRPGSVNMVQNGAIQQGRILPKPIPTFPQGTMEMLNFCLEVTEKMSGLSASLLGADQSNTPGVSLRRRLTSAMVLLAAEYDSLARFRKREGHLVFEFMKLLADDRLINIGGAFDGKTVPLTKAPYVLEYDIVLDENDQDPNLRQYYTEQITAIAPILIRTGNFFPELLDYINLPAQFRQRLKQGMQQSEQQKMEMAKQGIQPGGRGKPRSLEEIQADVNVKKGKAAKDFAQAQSLASNSRTNNIKSLATMILDSRRAAQEDRKMHQGDKQITLEALAKLFTALRPNPGGDA